MLSDEQKADLIAQYEKLKSADALPHEYLSLHFRAYAYESLNALVARVHDTPFTVYAKKNRK